MMSSVSPTLCLAQFLIDQPSFWVGKMVFHFLVLVIYRYRPVLLSVDRLFRLFRFSRLIFLFSRLISRLFRHFRAPSGH